MKVVQETPSRMVLENSSIILFVTTFIMVCICLVVIFQPPWIKVNYSGYPQNYVELVLVYGTLIFLVFLIKSNTTIVTVDKSNGRLTILSKSLIQSKMQNKCSLQDIEAVELRAVSEKGTMGYDVSVLIKDGHSVLLAKGSRMGGIHPGFSEPDAASKLAKFLNVPLREVRPPTINEMLGLIKEGLEK